MIRSIVFAAVVLFAACPLYATYLVYDRGNWPENWPIELEPLREQSRTLEGPEVLLLHYAVPFTNREDFEAVWPHVLAVKSKGAPIVLRRGPSFWLGKEANAGVCIHTPPKGEAPTAYSGKAGERYKTIYIELIVDGEIVDLNRLSLPAGTPIIDERFPEEQDAATSNKTSDEAVTMVSAFGGGRQPITETVQFQITGPSDSTITTMLGKDTVSLPGRLNLAANSSTAKFRLTCNFPVTNAAYVGSLTCLASNANGTRFLEANTISLDITESDLQSASSGVVTKFVFLPNRTPEEKWAGHLGTLTMGGVSSKQHDEFL